MMKGESQKKPTARSETEEIGPRAISLSVFGPGAKGTSIPAVSQLAYR